VARIELGVGKIGDAVVDLGLAAHYSASVKRMTLPTSDTIVDYPSGATSSSGTVVYIEGDYVILDRTACHPVDAVWPDQGADRAVLRVDGHDYEVTGCSVGATNGSDLFVGSEIPVRTGTEGWIFVVVHVVREPGISLNDTAEVIVDADYRAALSAGHTSCHLASLALDRALADAWSKDVSLDALGAPAFDALAIESSLITENGSRDLYRVGKSLRKKGFGVAALDDTSALEAAINATLEEWVASDAAVRIDRDDDGLSARRFWACSLPGGTATIPCGGTHLSTLAELASITVALEATPLEGAVALAMTTTAVRA
jgi:alanyl-tRNA synthetase